MSNEEDEFYKLNHQQIFWKMKEGEYLCQSLAKKLEDCSKKNSNFSTSTCEDFEKKLPICMMSNLSSLLKKCVSSLDIKSTLILPSEMKRIDICLNDEKIKKVFFDWTEMIQTPEMKDPKNFYKHEKLTHLSDDYSMVENDLFPKIKEKFERIKNEKLCQLEQENVEKCWKKMQNDLNETCFKEDSECYNCEFSVLCGKTIRECVQKNSHLGEFAYAVCLDGNTDKVQECIFRFQNYLNKQYNEIK
jgi:3-methyladenine DNA glycosylase AlkC